MATGTAGGRINLLDLDMFVRGEHHDAFRQLRQQAPVHWHERGGGRGFWSLVRYEDVLAVYRDAHTFSSARGMTLGDGGGDSSMDAADSAMQMGGGSGAGRIMGGNMLIMTDPPLHGKLRALVNKGFTPRMVGRLEPHIREIANEIIDRVVSQGECDFVVDAAAQLPLAVICEMLGVPRKDWDLMFDLTNRTIGATDPEYQQRGGSQSAAGEMFAYWMSMVQQRRDDWQDDLVGVLVSSEVDGEKLSDIDIMLFCFLLIIAGNETTRHATSGGMLALIEHPEQRERLAADPSLMPAAVEEILRWTTPVTHIARTATKDTDLGGNPVREGQRVVLWNISANRDEELFEDPFQFDVGRTPNEHLAFGFGEHFCLGANLARLELRVMIEETTRRLPDMELAGDVERLRSNLVGGIKHMPVRFQKPRS